MQAQTIGVIGILVSAVLLATFFLKMTDDRHQ